MTCQVVGGENICTSFLHVPLVVRMCAGVEGPESDEVFEHPNGDDQLGGECGTENKLGQVSCIVKDVF